VNGWDDFVSGGADHGHAVQIYRELPELAQSVASFFAAGFESGAPALLVATSEHRGRLLAALEARGWDADQLELDGMLVCRDAAALLDAIMRGGYPSSAAFDEVVGGLIDELADAFPGAQPRVFGEMVDVLSRRGEDDAAVSLEELWNSLAWSRSFSLLCGYELDVFDRDTQATRLPEICRTHSHVKPADDPRKLARAVDDALMNVLGASEAGQLYVLVSDELRQERIPSPQLLLMWVSEHMPAHAERILAAAREGYSA
jgi:MEDS: MEthanogen/methylotroph, DcmR Sensory domain